jgi:hypothetical protein
MMIASPTHAAWLPGLDDFGVALLPLNDVGIMDGRTGKLPWAAERVILQPGIAADPGEARYRSELSLDHYEKGK